MAIFGKTSPILGKVAATMTPAAGPDSKDVAAAVAAQTQQPEGRGPMECLNCKDCCQKEGWLDGKTNISGTCEGNWYAEEYELKSGRKLRCCCQGTGGPDPNAPADCLEGYKISGLSSAGCKVGWKKGDYGDKGFWCCKEGVADKSPCTKGLKTGSGAVLSGEGHKVAEPADCVVGEEALKDAKGNWWCCGTVVPGACAGGYAIEPNGTCTEALIKKTIGGKTYCCPKDCTPGVDKTCPSGYKCDPATSKCVFAEGQKGECGIGADGDKVCEEKLGKGARCMMTADGPMCKAATDLACPEGKGIEYPGCPCGKTYVSMTGNCIDLYILEAKTKGTTGWEGWKPGAAGRCDCISYCKATGCDEKCENCEQGLTFNWSAETQALLKRLMGRANYFLDYPSGYTPEQRNAIVNQALKGIKAKERGNLQGIRDVFGRQGLAGSGLQMEREMQARREGRESTADFEARIAIEEENKRYQEMAGTTGLAQNLLSLIMGAEQVPEVLNAARRGEGTTSMSAVLQLLATMMGSSQQGLGAILQAIMAQQPGTTGSSSGGNDWGDISSWLAYILQGK